MADPPRQSARPATEARSHAPASRRSGTGELRERRSKAGLATYTLRVRWKGRRINVRLGTELDGWNRPLAERELQRVVAEIQAGVWRPPVPELPIVVDDPILHEFATVWIARHRLDSAPNTNASYSHILSRYILPEFKDHRLTEITHEAILRWRDRLRQESAHLTLAREHGVPVLSKSGKPVRPFGAPTINEALRLLGQILDRAVESEQYAIQRNPVKARSGLRVKNSRRPPREHFEADEVLSLIEAADMLDTGVTPQSLARAETARQLRAQGLAWGQIGEELGCAETTAIYLSRVQPRIAAPRRRRTIVVVLSLTGVRASEYTELVWGRVDHTHGRIVLDDSKSDAGVREVHLSPYVRRELALYRSSLGHAPGPNEPVFAVRGGGADNRFNLGLRLKRVAAVAAELRAAAGLAPMPTRITPHTFRRTFATLCFQAGKDLPFVQRQLGHANWKTTLEIYTQQSGRTNDPRIRALLERFLGDAADAGPA